MWMPWDPLSQLVQGLYRNGSGKKEENGREREQATLLHRARATRTEFEVHTVPHAGNLTSTESTVTRTNSLSKLFLFYGTIEEK